LGRIGPETLHQTLPSRRRYTSRQGAEASRLITHAPARNLRRYLGRQNVHVLFRLAGSAEPAPAARSSPQTRAPTRASTDATGRPTRDP
jgi:hypothetical protein